jgi:hypothetical protein
MATQVYRPGVEQQYSAPARQQALNVGDAMPRSGLKIEPAKRAETQVFECRSVSDARWRGTVASAIRT